MIARTARIRGALRAAARRPVRNGLAVAGTAIAVGALLVAVAVAERGRRAALDEIRRMGASVLIVSAEDDRNRGTRQRTGSVVTTLTSRDARLVESEVPGIRLLAAEYRATVPATVGGLARPTTVAGVEPSYSELRDAPVARGAFFTATDDDAAARVVVLGASLARALFANRDPLGGQIRLRGIPFTIIGVLPDRGAGLDAFDEDEVAFVPLKTARRRLFHVAYVQRFYIRTSSAQDTPEVGAAIVALLDTRHHHVPGEPREFRVQDQGRLVSLRDNTIRQLGRFELAFSAALVGTTAIGALALQLLTVRERRVEIGTRRAVGATRGMILAQFLIESGVVSIAGAALGLTAGLTVDAAIAARFPIAAASAAAAAVVALSIAAAAVPALAAAGRTPAAVLRAA